MKAGDIVYLCFVVPTCDVYDVLRLTIRTAQDDWAVGVDEHTKQAYIFTDKMIDKYVFTEQYEAQEAILQFRAANEIEVADNDIQT